ncbi:uncharacterized protein LOC106158158 [Lingula anatina]|uniref:Uncharacterized protein LOC106158158 n=1 Tax=Lingula anatina TaxID=7574 RepID=A0A1S3HVD7_LINAN|nr:uncharacterized protein LOC106158158 [Lingula anatina]|eukprot:XP_013389506.1 uncharacterized protein LOC106158158 [Lingula anatina]
MVLHTLVQSPLSLLRHPPSQILYWGTPFQIAGVGKGTLNDLMEIYTQAVNKVQQTHAGLLKQMTAYSDGLMSGKTSVKKFSLLQEFCTLSVQLDRFSRFLGAQKDIVKHVCLDEKGLPEMFSGLLICQKIKDFVSPWQTDSKEQKIVQRYAGVNAGRIADDSWKNIHGIHHKVLKDLHSQGIILYLSQLPEPIVILNIEVFAAVMNKALNCSTPVPMSTPVLYLPDGQKVYTCQNLKEAVTSIDSAIDDKNFQILYKMIDDLGILQQAKSFRTSLTPEDWTYLFFNCRTVQQPSIPLEDFNCPPNAPVIKKTQTYTYPAGFHRDLLPAIFAACEQFVSPEIVWAQGFLCRHDGIEVMVNETITGVGTGMITLSGQSYRPEDERAKAEMERSILLEMYIYGMVIDSVLGETQTLAFRQGDLSELLDIKVDPCLCQEHVWSRPDGTYPWDYKVTVCSRCNNCSDKGKTCPWNGIKERRLSSGEVWASSLKQLDSGQETCHLGTEWHLPVMFENLEECGCDTEIRACRRCGLCRHCAYVLGTIHARVDPGYGSLMNNLVTHEAAMTTYHCEYPLDGTVHQIVNISAMKYLNQDFQGIVLLTSFLQDEELKLLIGEGGAVTLMVGQQAEYPAASYGLLRSLEKGDVLSLKVAVYPGSMERFDQNGVTKLIDEDASVVQLPMYLQVILNGVCLNTYMIPNLEWYPTLVAQGQQAGEFRGWNFECPTMPLVIRSSFPGGSVPTLTALDEEEDCYVYNCSVDESPRGTVVSFRKEEDPFLSYCIIKMPLAGLDPANFMEVEFQDVDICGKFYMGPIWFSDAEVEAMDFRETVSYVLSVWDDEKLKRSLDCGDRVSVVVDMESVQNVSAENAEVRVTWELPAGRTLVTTLPLYNQSESGVKGQVHMAILFQKNPEFPSPKGPTVKVTKFGNLDYNLLPAPVKTLSCRRVDPGDRTEIALTYSSGTMTANDTPHGTWLLLPELTEAVLKKVTLKKLLEFGNLTAMLACQNTRPAWIHPRGYPRYPAHFHLIDMAPQKVKTSAEAVLMFENMLMNRIYRGLAQRKVSLPLLDSTNPQEREKIEYLFQERYLSFCAAICRHVWKGGFTSERQAAVPWIKELSETYGDLQAGLMENHNHGCREIHDKPDEVKGPHVSLKQGENLEKFKFDKNRGTEYAVAVVLQKTDTDLEKIPVQSEDLSTLYLTCGQPSWFEPSTYSDGNLELTTQLPATWKMKNLGKFCVNGLITTSQNVSSMECKNLTVVDVSESLVETLPDFRVLPKVREVNASHSMVTIQSLTSCHIDQLKYLVSLSLDELLLDSLPRSFGQLKTLQYLSIKGIPWLRGDEDPQCGQAETSGLSNSVAKVAARTSCIVIIPGNENMCPSCASCHFSC